VGLLKKRVFGRRIPLVEAVELTSVEIFGTSMGAVQGLIPLRSFSGSLGTNPDELNRTAWDLILELMIFSLHLADRIAFDVLGSDRRAKFMNALVANVTYNLASTLTDKSEHAQRDFEAYFIQLCNVRTTSYAPLGVHASGAPLKGTLFWEAGKLAAAEHFSEDAPTVALILPLTLTFGACVGALKELRGRLEQLADA
jgi:hypothetical protein